MTTPSFPHTFSGGICIHCHAGWGSPAHVASPTECPGLRQTMQALQPAPNDEDPPAPTRRREEAP